MGINIYYDTALGITATATPRQWRVRGSVVIDGATTVIDQLFPDYLSTLVAQGYITTAELKAKLGEIVTWAAQKRLGVS